MTAFLQNVTVREALQVLLEIKGLTYQQIGRSNTYVVTPRSRTAVNLITRIYTLSYIPLISIGSVDSEKSALSPQTSTSLGGAGATGAGKLSAESEVAIVRVLESVLSKSGKVTLEPRTNSLIVTDIPEVFPQVEQIIAELDKKAPQIMIEAQIVEIDSTRSRHRPGVAVRAAKLIVHRRQAGHLFRYGCQPSPHALRSHCLRQQHHQPIGSTQASQDSTSTEDTSIRQFLQTSVLDLTALSITLRALVSRSEARFLGKPKILTLNNKAAIIQVAAEAAVSAQVTQTATAGGLGSAGVSIERVQTGLKLVVTPQVNKDGYITMLVQPSFTDVQESAISTARSRVFDSVSRGASTLARKKNGRRW